MTTIAVTGPDRFGGGCCWAKAAPAVATAAKQTSALPAIILRHIMTRFLCEFPLHDADVTNTCALCNFGNAWPFRRFF
jgi:hypothetical protein